MDDKEIQLAQQGLSPYGTAAELQMYVETINRKLNAQEAQMDELKDKYSFVCSENERLKRDQQAERSLNALLPEDISVNDTRTELRIEIGHGTIIVEPLCGHICTPMLSFRFERTITQRLA